MSAKDSEQYKKTRAILAAMQLDPSGWNQQIHDSEVPAGPQVFIYAYDLPTRWTWMGSVKQDIFDQLSAMGHQDKGSVEMNRGGVAYVMSGAADRKPVDEVDGLDWEQQLGAFLGSYAGTTRTWELAERFAKGGHFIVLNYRKAGRRDGMLRPFAMRSSDNKILPVDELEAAIKEVIALDRKAHPDWFLG